jgi:hypothetical protein
VTGEFGHFVGANIRSINSCTDLRMWLASTVASGLVASNGGYM